MFPNHIWINHYIFQSRNPKIILLISIHLLIPFQNPIYSISPSFYFHEWVLDIFNMLSCWGLNFELHSYKTQTRLSIFWDFYFIFYFLIFSYNIGKRLTFHFILIANCLLALFLLNNTLLLYLTVMAICLQDLA